MAIKTEAIGKEWPATTYEVGKEKIGEYARVIGLDNPVHFDREAAKAAGYRDVVAPPMFCVVYSAPALGPAMFDPEVGMNFAAMVHGGQEFEWGEPACSGDEITTTAKCLEIFEKDGKGFYVFETNSVNQDGEQVVQAAPGPTSSGGSEMAELERGRRRSPSCGSRPTSTCRTATRAPRATSTRSTSTPSSPKRSGCRTRSCTAST